MTAGDWPEGSGPSMAADNDLTTSYYDNYVLGSSWTVRFPAARVRGGCQCFFLIIYTEMSSPLTKPWSMMQRIEPLPLCCFCSGCRATRGRRRATGRPRTRWAGPSTTPPTAANGSWPTTCGKATQTRGRAGIYFGVFGPRAQQSPEQLS